MDELNLFTKAALVANLLNNDLHYIHWLAQGEDFDKIHNLAQEYYEKIDGEADYLTELALENRQPIYNPSVALEIVPDYEPEAEPSYDYETAVITIQDKLSFYVDSLNELREDTNNASIQSRLDDMIRYWEKEVNYKLSRRMDYSLSGFINTGLDDRLAEIYGGIDE